MFSLGKARALMNEKGLDGILICSQENFGYVVGCNPKSYLSRKIGSEIVVVPADESKEPIIIVSEHDRISFEHLYRYKDVRTFETWIYFERDGVPQQPKVFKPAQFDCMGKVVEAIQDLGLGESNLGYEESLMPASFYIKLRSALPEVKLVDATDVMLTLRSVKDEQELQKMRKAVAIMEKAAIASMQIAKEGATDRDIAAEFKKVAVGMGCWIAGHNGQVIISAGPDAGAAHLAGPHPVSVLKNGDILRFDYGVNYDGILTDFARAYVIGDEEPSERLKKLHDTILRANRTMIASIKPGLRFCDLFAIGMDVVKDVYPTYARGHLGHNISYGPNNEEGPFISPKETSEIKENMVLCIEVPFYIIGFGGINIEDMVIVKKDGVEELTHMSRDIHLPLLKYPRQEASNEDD